tara:strand:+ start:3954 stop:5138 length:1185 start_codon:yes stop_codon:yes gene_type:complete
VNETGDFDFYPAEHSISFSSTDGEKVEIEWSDGHQSKFNFLWLRDNCPCCVHPDTMEPLFNVASIADDEFISSVSTSEEGFLQVVWSKDSHISHFHPGWLRANCFLDASNRFTPKAIAWDSKTRKEPKRFNWDEIISKTETEREWLFSLVEDGCSITQNVDPSKDGLIRITERIGVVRETNFGLFFNVEAKNGPDTAAYTEIELPPHTDLPTREYQPGLQLLHCLKNSVKGGESILVDGFRVAEEIRLNHPEAFDLLTTIPWDFGNRSTVSDYRWRAPMINVGLDGEINEVRVGNFLRVPLQVDFDLVEPMYKAYKLFETLNQEDRFKLSFRLNQGECLIFDNRRVLHARNSFDPSKGERHFCGCYIERDELWSSIRMIDRRNRQKIINSSSNE